MTAEDAQRLARDLLEAFNAADWERCREMIATSVSYEEAPSGYRARESNAALERLQNIRAAAPDLRGVADHWVVSPDNSAVAAVLTWTHADDPDRVESLGTLLLRMEEGRLTMLHETHITRPHGTAMCIPLDPRRPSGTPPQPPSLGEPQ